MKFQLHKVLDESSQMSILDEVADNSSLFGKNPIRTSYEGSAHAEVSDILLRGPMSYDDMQNKKAPTFANESLHIALDCYDYPDYKLFKVTRDHVIDLYRLLNVMEMGRVLITGLNPSRVIYPHTDEGPVPKYYRRFHYVIQDGGCDMFTIGNQSQEMKTGQLWEVDVKQTHACMNLGTRSRIHLIMDFH